MRLVSSNDRQLVTTASDGATIRAVNATGPRGLPGPGAAAWTAATAVTAGEIRQAPDGSRIVSKAARTTGATFDATEEAFWDVVGSKAGTFEQRALSATIADIGIGRTTRTKHAPALGLYFPEAEGAVGDGTTDDTAAFQALDALIPDGATILGDPTKTYRVTNVEFVGKSFVLDLNGADLILQPWDGVATAAEPGIKVRGSLGTARSFTSVLAGATSLTLATPAHAGDFAPGDHVVLHDAHVFVNWDGNSNNQGREEINIVESANSSTGVVTFSIPLEQNYNDAATLTKMTPVVAPTIRNSGKITEVDPGLAWPYTSGVYGIDDHTPHLIQFRYCIAPRVERLRFDGWNMHAVNFAYCLDPTEVELIGAHPYRPTVGGHGYLSRALVCRNALADRVTGIGCRHVTDAIMSFDCGSRDSMAYAPVNVAFYGHGHQSRRLHSTRDTVLQGGGSGEVAGWGLGNPTYGPDFGFRIDSPTFRGVGWAFSFGYQSTDMVVTNADIATGKRPFYVSTGAAGLRVKGGKVTITQTGLSAFDATMGLLDGRQQEAATSLPLGDVTFEDVDVYGEAQSIRYQGSGDLRVRRVRHHSPNMDYSGSALVYTDAVAPRDVTVDGCTIDGGKVRSHVKTVITPTGRQRYDANSGKALLSSSLIVEITANTIIEGNRYTLADGTTPVEISPTLASTLSSLKGLGAVLQGNFPATYDGGVPGRDGQAGLYVPARFHALGTRALVANRTFAGRFVPETSRKPVKVAFSVQTASSANDTIDVAIWDSTGAKVASSGPTAGLLNSTGRKEVTIPGVVLTPGKVYYAGTTCGAIGGTAAILDAISAGGTNSVLATLFGSTYGTMEMGYQDGASGTAPAALTLSGGVVGSSPLLTLIE